MPISLLNLSVGLLPVGVVLVLMIFWSLSVKRTLLSIVRMLIQLLAIGYVLTFIFSSQNPWIICLVLSLMLLAASWIALSSVTISRLSLLRCSLIAIFVSSIFTLTAVTQGVMYLEPWFSPEVIIPIAGMIFSSSMNTVSLSAERFFSEYRHTQDYVVSRNIAFQAAMIPVTNSLFAVGLVSLPGMMTGQILSGVSPLIAARYQIMVMLMILGASGISSALFLMQLKKDVSQFILPR